MKKIALGGALLAVCSCSYAQSSVTMYGIIDNGITYLSNSGGHSNTLIQSGLWLGSRLGFLGQEDLGGGTRAIFRLENGFDVSNGKLGQNGRLFGRQAYVGLASEKYGQLTLGRQYDFAQSEFYIPLNLGRVFGPVNDLDNAGNTWRLNNSIRYETPRFYGFSGGAMLSMGGQPGAFMNGSTWSAGGDYKQGAVYVGAAYTMIHDPRNTWYDGTVTAANNVIYGAYAVAATRLRIAGVAASYKFSAVTVNAGITDNVFTAGFEKQDVRFDNYYLNMQYQLAPAWAVKVYAYYTTSKRSATGTGPNYEQGNIALVYDLSKRTDVYGIVAFQHATGGALAQLNQESASSNSNQLAVHIGLVTRF